MKDPIIINDFQKEIAPSSFLGFEQIRNLNTVDRPGAIFPNGVLTKHSGTSVTNRMTWLKSQSSEFWGVDYAGNVYDIVNTTYTKVTGVTTNVGQGLEIWKGYVLVFSNVNVDTINLTGNTVSTTWGGSAIDSSTVKPSTIMDDVLYVGAGKYIYSLEEVAGKTFDPSDATTFVYNKRALTIPDDYIIVQVTGFGDWLAIGTRKSSDADVADVFLWDRVNPFTQQVKISGAGVMQMASLNNLLYVHVGGTGQWYVTNGSSVEPFARMPQTLVSAYPSSTAEYGGVAVYKNKIYFTILSEASDVPFGIYSLNTKTGGFLLEHTISTNNVDDNNVKRIGSLLVKDGKLYAGWQDNGTYGVDIASQQTYYTSDRAFFTTQFYRIATKLSPHTFQSLEVQLSTPLVTNSSVKVYYRTDRRASWTLALTMDTVGAQSAYEPFGITAESIQFKVVLNNTAELLEVRAI